MALKNIPQAERLLSGTLTSYLSDVATTCVMSDPPSKFPTYIELEPDSTTKKELVRAVTVSGSTVTIERSVNGVTTDHAANATYKQKLTSRHWDAVSDALEKGYLMEDALRALIRVSDTQFTITGYGASDDLTGTYTIGRVLRINSSASYVMIVTLSSYNAGTNKTTIDVSATLPTPVSTVEFGIAPLGGTNLQQTLTSPVINTGFSGTAKASAAEVATGTEDAKIVTPLAAAPYANSSLSRQALINGNFDVWQRGTSIAWGNGVYTADRWLFVTGSGQTGTITQQDGTGVVGSRYSCRVQRTSGQLASNNEFYYAMESVDSIKLRGKKLTLSFWAKCGANFSPTSSLLPVAIVTGKGTDQKVASFTTTADAIAENKTLTTSWQLFTITTTAVIASDITQIGLRFSNYTTGTASTNDWFEITQVQLCAGDVALPFQPKSFEEELRACMRYCYQINGATDALSTSNQTATVYYGSTLAPTTMRVYPSLETSTVTGSAFTIVSSNASYNISSMVINANNTSPNVLSVSGAMATATANAAGLLRIANANYIRFIAEL